MHRMMAQYRGTLHRCSAAMKEMLRFGSRILFIDPFYDPFNARYKDTFRECLNIVKTLNPDDLRNGPCKGSCPACASARSRSTSSSTSCAWRRRLRPFT